MAAQPTWPIGCHCSCWPQTNADDPAGCMDQRDQRPMCSIACFAALLGPSMQHCSIFCSMHELVCMAFVVIPSNLMMRKLQVDGCIWPGPEPKTPRCQKLGSPIWTTQPGHRQLQKPPWSYYHLTMAKLPGCPTAATDRPDCVLVHMRFCGTRNALSAGVLWYQGDDFNVDAGLQARNSSGRCC